MEQFFLQQLIIEYGPSIFVGAIVWLPRKEGCLT